ncbi:MAG TPA: PAS domain S-box protein [Bacteroidota bacterium]|nr:PAS domain S-box protein [Bacteroidota bacterium]
MRQLLFGSLRNLWLGRLTQSLLVLFTAHSAADSQFDSFNDAWRWVHFTTESGLPSNHLTNVVETKDGTTWAATSLGLAYYDGFRWNRIADTSRLLQSAPSWVTPDADNSILAIFNGQLFRCTRSHVEHIPFTYHGKVLSIVQIAPARDSSYLIRADVLYRYKGDSLVSMAVPFSYDLTSSEDFFLSRAGSVWMNTRQGVFRWDSGNWVTIIAAGKNSYQIASLIENADGTAFISITHPFESRGLWEWNQSLSSCIRTEEGQDVIRAMDSAPDGLTLAIYQSGIRIRSGSVWNTVNNVPAPLQDVRFVKFRSSGDLWVANEGGLFLYKRSSRRWQYWKHFSPDLKNTIHDILRTSDGSVWLGTASGVEIHKYDGTIVEIERILGKQIHLVTGLCEDDDGNVWISSGGSFSGAYRWDGVAWKHFGKDEGLDAPFIHRIRKDREGRLWFLGLGATYYGPQPGAFAYDKGKFTAWDTTSGLLNGRVYSFGQSTDGALWFGTLGGLSRWRDSIWTHWSRAEYPEIGPIFALDIDKHGRVWFADRNTGVWYIENDDRPHNIATSYGLVDNRTWDLKFDNEGVLWMTTYGGVAIYRDGCWSAIGRASGLNNLKLWPILLEGSAVYIGTEGNGVDILNLDESHNPPPQLDVDKAILDGENALLRWKAHAYWGQVPSLDIETRYRVDQGSWSPWSKEREVRFTEMAFGNHLFQLQAKSLFGKYDSTERSVAFSIPPPVYLRPAFAVPISLMCLAVLSLGIVLVVRKRQHSRAMRISEAKFRRLTEATFEGIVIHNSGIILDVNPSVTTMFGYRHSELIGKNIVAFVAPGSKELVEERIYSMSEVAYEAIGIRKDGTRIVVEIIGKPLPFNGRKAQVVAIRDITERKFVEGQLIANREQLRLLAAELSATEERERRRMAAYLHDAIGQALALCRLKLGKPDEILSGDDLNDIRTHINRAIENTQSLTFDLSPPILYELSFEDAIEWLTEQMSNDHKLPIYFHTEHEITSMDHGTRILLFNAVRELLFNIVKHAQAHSAKVSIEATEPQISISVKDDGRGFDVAQMNNHTGRSGGFGLFNIRERVMHLGGCFAVNSEPGQGTKVVISVPLASPQFSKEGKVP